VAVGRSVDADRARGGVRCGGLWRLVWRARDVWRRAGWCSEHQKLGKQRAELVAPLVGRLGALPSRQPRLFRSLFPQFSGAFWGRGEGVCESRGLERAGLDVRKCDSLEC
jgi:hypothetical protein